ncbi:salicylate hydroxylase [Colletotrichum truncatum]|uniref:Salicylate hydroxylase n=1 Tax=Colletotrichum truncatum TaxID=5467 RepID=A0ACC3ZC97_COLTU|nr:salicylate hydroxylase [Colletotrichum truncatum]KAF6797679.1 salicylate hydroxylase [Colletotrichum truncatum]
MPSAYPMTAPVPKTIGIIGAAIAGPTFALHVLTHPVLRARYRPVLFDQSPPPVPIPNTPNTAERAATGPGSPSTALHHQRAGASVGLFANGLHPLYSLGLGDVIKQHGYECDDVALWFSSVSPKDNGKSNELQHIKTARNAFWSHDFQTGVMYFERANLQALLVNRVRELGGEVRWSKKAVRFDAPSPPGRDQTRVSFADGTHTDVDLLVGADGGYSPVRRHILALRNPNTAEERWLPDSMGMTGIYGISSADKLPSTHVPERPFNETHCVFLPEGFLSTGPCPEGKFRWDLVLPESATPDTPASGEPNTSVTSAASPSSESEPWLGAIVPGQYPVSATAHILRSRLRARHPFTGDFEMMLNTADRIIHTPLRQRAWKEDEIQWAGGGSNIVLIGDAARLMLPTSGQGTGFAVEDATVLASMLLKHCSSPTDTDGTSEDGFHAALEEYARSRTTRSKKMAAVASWAGSVWMGTTWYHKLLRYGSARLTPSVDLKTKQGKDAWPMDGRFNVEV